MAAESTYWKNAVQGAIQFIDGTGTPVTLTLGVDKGDLKVTNLGEHLNAPVFLERRGHFGSFARGARQYPVVTFSCFVGNIVGSSTSAPGSVYEFLTRKGAYSANVSTLGASRNYAIDIKLLIEGTLWGDTADEQVTFEDCVATCEYSESLDGNTLAVSATCLGRVVHVNNTNTVNVSEVA